MEKVHDENLLDSQNDIQLNNQNNNQINHGDNIEENDIEI